MAHHAFLPPLGSLHPQSNAPSSGFCWPSQEGMSPAPGASTTHPPGAGGPRSLALGPAGPCVGHSWTSPRLLPGRTQEFRGATGSHRRQRWPQCLWLEVVDTVQSRLGPGHAPHPPGGRLGHPTTCGPGNKKTEFSGDVAPGKAHRGQLLTPAAVSVLCDGGTPGAWSCRGTPRHGVAAGRASLGTQ